MNQGKSDGKYQPCAPSPYIQTAVCQHTINNQWPGFFQGSPAKYLPEGTQNRLPMAMNSTQTPQPLPSTFQYCRDVLYCRQPYSMPPLPGGFSGGYPIKLMPEATQNLPSTAMTSTQSLQPAQRPPGHNKETLDGPQKNCPAGDLTACQLRNPSSSLPQGISGASTHSTHKPSEDALQKRELRLMKNREAARECRRKKKEYVKCLENRVAVLENQNKTLIEELRALKDIYRHKFE